MNPVQVNRFAQHYAMQYDISERQARNLISNALGQDPSGKVLIFALALLAQDVDIDTILKAMSFGESAWYRSATMAL
ncbi:MAG TPA: hypothetical protein VD789_00370 [Thermomicrobiales bacterium]|nr:hypothetical protein [Thermomicrobiales bacterium]